MLDVSEYHIAHQILPIHLIRFFTAKAMSPYQIEHGDW